MKPIGLFYGSDGGNTEGIAEEIQKAFGDGVELFNVAKASKEQIASFDNIILACPTYGEGDLQSDWEDFLPTLSEDDFAGKTLALVGLGDQDGYGDTFCDALFLIYEKIAGKANLIGQTSTDGYDYEESKAIVDGKFVGLVLDQDNQDDLTSDRITQWVNDIKPLFA